jgi:predicted amidohydrolase
VTTECFLDGYSIADKSIPLDEYRALGEPIPDGPYYKRLAALARELRVHVIAGITEADGENRYNTAVFINPDGELAGKYRKQKLGHELPRNTPGNVSTVHATQFGRMGIMICADRTDPQIVQKYSVNNAEFLVCPSGGNFGPRSNDPIVQARSRENHIPIVFVHPTEFLVTAPDGAIQRQLLLGDRLFIEKAQMGSDLDCNQVCCFDLPVKRVGSIGDAGGE